MRSHARDRVEEDDGLYPVTRFVAMHRGGGSAKKGCCRGGLHEFGSVQIFRFGRSNDFAVDAASVVGGKCGETALRGLRRRDQAGI
jgi:hypothetical protein